MTGHDNIDVEGALAISYALKFNQSLQELYLSKIIFWNKYFTYIIEGDNQVGSDGARAISEALLTNHTLQRLNLSNLNRRYIV